MRCPVWMLVLIEGCCLACLLASISVRAATEMGTARIELLPALNINQDAEIDFGRINNVDGTCVMGAAGTLSGSPGMDCAGTGTPGAFTVTGNAGSTILLTMTPGSQGGITFQPQVQGGSQRTLTDGAATVNILGNIVVDGAGEGIHQIPYTFTANYQ